MASQSNPNAEWALASRSLYDVYFDFLLSRQAMMCSERTISWYAFTLDKVMAWMVKNGVAKAEDITARHVRAYLSELAERGLTDSYIHNHARATRTMLRFFLTEEHIHKPVTFKMPAIADKRLLCLTADDVQKVLKACTTARDKALISLMVDTGLRRAEVCALNWEDIDISSGLVRVVRGKGGKFRSVVVGAITRRVLLAYRRELNPDPDVAVFQTPGGGRFTGNGLRSLFVRLEERSGVEVNPHSLRRTFATTCLRAGMNPLHLQGLLGHSTLEMTKHYIQMLDEDLLEAHKAHGPIDNIMNKARK